MAIIALGTIIGLQQHVCKFKPIKTSELFLMSSYLAVILH